MAASVLRVFTLNVGQGTTTLVQAPDGGTILVDCYKGNKTLQLLQDLNVGRIDLLATTHPHHDHLAGVPSILERCEVAEWWDSGAPAPLPAYMQAMESALEKGVRPTRIKGLNVEKPFGDLTLKIISPSPRFRYELDAAVRANDGLLPREKSFNDYSFVLSLRYQNFNMILGADAEMSGWAAAVEYMPKELPCQVLVLPHHGSSRGAYFQLIEQMGPSHIVLSYGEGNRYGHPDSLTLEAINKYVKVSRKKVAVWHTPEHGTILVESTGSAEPQVRGFGDSLDDGVPVGDGTDAASG